MDFTTSPRRCRCRELSPAHVNSCVYIVKRGPLTAVGPFWGGQLSTQGTPNVQNTDPLNMFSERSEHVTHLTLIIHSHLLYYSHLTAFVTPSLRDSVTPSPRRSMSPSLRHSVTPNTDCPKRTLRATQLVWRFGSAAPARPVEGRKTEKTLFFYCFFTVFSMF